jgi:hypothetical protein
MGGKAPLPISKSPLTSAPVLASNVLPPFSRSDERIRSMSKRMRRLGLLAAPVVVALAFASAAAATVTPSFSATTTAQATIVSYAQQTGDDPVAALTFYVPVDYAALLAQPEGETVGTVSGTAIAADLANTPLQLKGNITAALATTTVSFAGATVPLSALAAICTPSVPVHTAYWILNLSASGQTLQVPAYVDDVPLSSPLANVANNAITICLPPPDVPAGTPGRASLGAKLVSATLSVTDVFSAAPAWYMWHATVTPYTPGTGKANVAGTLEVQSLDRTPQALTLAAKLRKPGSVLVSGKLVAGGKGVPGAAVTVLAGKRKVGTATTKAGGVFSILLKASGAAKFSATTVVTPKKAASCTAALAPTCAGQWVAGFTATSAAVKAK